MYDRFTDRARKVMQLANEEARRFNHEYIGTEHILLGLIKEGTGVAANVLTNLDIDLRKIRREIEKIVQAGPDRVTTQHLPQTPRTKKVIEYAIEEARKLGHTYVGTEHLLLGLLCEQEGVASQILINLGLKLEDVRVELHSLLGIEGARELPRTGQPATRRSPPEDRPDVPEEIARDLAKLQAEIDQLQRDKEAAVGVADFEKAASLRDQVVHLKKQGDILLRDWLAQHAVNPDWLNWNGGTVFRMAVLIGTRRRWEFLPLLGEILQAAGCTDTAILDHCREPGPHSSHCWVTDLLMVRD
jgi:ATP-dependent Clp protease ATP-binding subunit ClpA